MTLYEENSQRCVSQECISSLLPTHAVFPVGTVQNNGCGGNDRQRGLYAAEWSRLSGDTVFVLSGEEVQGQVECGKESPEES